MKITVLYNSVEVLSFGKPEDILADEDTVKTARAVGDAIASLGHEVKLFEVNPATVGRVTKSRPDFFFNLAEGLGSIPKSEANVAEMLEKIGIPYSGSGPEAMRLTMDKVATKELLFEKGLPTAKWQVFTNHDRLLPELRFPVIVKPGAEDCSLGITGHSVVSRPDDVYRLVGEVQKSYPDPVLVEEYIDGRELNVTVLGNGGKAQALPISEIIFGESFKGHYKVVDFAAKWEESSVEYRETLGVCPAKLPASVERRVMEVARQAYLLTGCRDYARVDIRLDDTSQPFILEVNDNPAIGPGDGTIRSAKAAGMSYSQFIERVIAEAIGRFRSHSREVLV